MNNSNNGMSFLQGLLVGATVGAVAGILFAPKSGAETREDIKQAAKKYEGKAQDLYNNAKTSVDRKVAALKEAGKNIDKKKYAELVDNVVAEMQGTANLTEQEGKALGAQLKADSGEVIAAIKA